MFFTHSTSVHAFYNIHLAMIMNTENFGTRHRLVPDTLIIMKSTKVQNPNCSSDIAWFEIGANTCSILPVLFRKAFLNNFKFCLQLTTV